MIVRDFAPNDPGEKWPPELRGRTLRCACSKARQITFLMGGSMSAFERLLVPSCTELPECRCGLEMQIESIEQLPERSDAGIRIYNRPACHHEMRLRLDYRGGGLRLAHLLS
jgi:hypothetical protein